jgi:hypothetical protein
MSETPSSASASSRNVSHRTLRHRLSVPRWLRHITTYGAAYDRFLQDYPGYARTTSTFDGLRRKQFTRLAGSGEVYVDYMGGGLYPEGLVAQHAAQLKDSLFGNIHSVSNRSSGIIVVTLDIY